MAVVLGACGEAKFSMHSTAELGASVLSLVERLMAVATATSTPGDCQCQPLFLVPHSCSLHRRIALRHVPRCLRAQSLVGSWPSGHCCVSQQLEAAHDVMGEHVAICPVRVSQAKLVVASGRFYLSSVAPLCL